MLVGFACRAVSQGFKTYAHVAFYAALKFSPSGRTHRNFHRQMSSLQTRMNNHAVKPDIPFSKIQPRAFADRPAIILVSCGSFSPITNLHLRLFEAARDWLMFEHEKFDVVGGIASPVHDAYGKKDLVPADQRLAMTRLATASSTWVDVSSWETSQGAWSRTCDVLQAYQDFYSANLPFTVQVKLLCGADILDSCLNPQVWTPDDLQNIFGKFGVVCLERTGHSAVELINENDALYKYRTAIHLVPQHIANNISSTAVRRQIRRGLSIKYLVPDEVERYIRENKLYVNLPATKKG